MKWVTWKNIGVDRMACAWIIRKLVDPKAEFDFIDEGETTVPKGAEAFDIPGVRLSHHQGHCSFYAILRHYKLQDPILHRIARIVDEADTVQEVSVEPAAAGLDLICRGVRLTSRDDYEAVERGAQVYESVYAALTAEAVQEA